MQAYPEINPVVLEDVVSRWASRYSFINQITFYPHAMGGDGDEAKLFLLDICLDDDAPPYQVSIVDSHCCPIYASRFFKDLNRVKAEGYIFERDNWELFSRFKKDSLPTPFIHDVCKGKVLFSRPDIDTTTFPNLNVEFLKRMTNRWVNKYKNRGVDFERILLYHYASDYVGGRNPVKYAIVIEIYNYDGKYEFSANDTSEDIELKGIEGAKNAYYNFIRDTCYRCGERPDELLYSDFSGVYLNVAPDNYYSEWELIPQYKGISLSEHIRVDEGFIVLYSAENSDMMGPQNAVDKIEIDHQRNDIPIAGQKKKHPKTTNATVTTDGMTHKESERFIKNIIVSPRDTESFNVQIPKKPTEFISTSTCGFKKPNTNKEWALFTETISFYPFCYNIKGHPKYDTELKRFGRMSNKVLNGIKKHFPLLNLQANYKIHFVKDGICRFKFRIPESGEIEIEKVSDRKKKDGLKKNLKNSLSKPHFDQKSLKDCIEGASQLMAEHSKETNTQIIPTDEKKVHEFIMETNKDGLLWEYLWDEKHRD